MAEKGKKGYWLFKQEPTCYSYADLERDGQTTWDGVTNSLAQQNLRRVRKGDRVLLYHTGKEKAVVGEMVVVSEPHAATADDSSAVVLEVRPVRRLAPVSLARIKEDASLRGWDLVRLPRLSVVPVTPAQWQRVEELSATPPPPPGRG
jgi:predicted RNA-binding protein with PUA-like domain